MLHPILGNYRNLYGYLLVWVLLAAVQVLILVYFYQVDWVTAAADSIIFNLLFCGLGLGLWYVVRFVNVEKETVFSILLHHLAAAIASLLLWLLLGRWLVSSVLSSEVYQVFIRSTLPWRLLIGLLFYSVLILLYYLVMYYANFREKIEHEAALNAAVKEAELAMLRSQINPHFIFNSLNSISSLTMALPEKAQEMTIKLSDFLRYSLGQDTRQLSSLAEEMRNVQLYMDIEKIRFGSRMQYEQWVEEGCLDKRLPNMILQPLFENAIKHGVYESLEQVTIRLECACERGFLKITLSNTYDPEGGGAKKGGGIGQKNIRQRLQLLYGRTDLLSVQRHGDTYEVSLLIPQL